MKRLILISLLLFSFSAFSQSTAFIYGTGNRESTDSVEAASPRLKSLYPDSFAKMRTDIFSELPN